jgi:ClpP class serine protease
VDFRKISNKRAFIGKPPMNSSEQFIGRLLCSCWNIDKLRGRSILSSFIQRLRTEGRTKDNPASRPASDRPAEDIFGDPLPKMQIRDDVAIIPIYGVVSIDLPDWIKAYGLDLVDANDIEQEVQQALDNENVKFSVYDCSSPGGLSIAGDKLFDVTDRARRKKPIFAFCWDGRDMASTCYEAVASCTAIMASPFADGVGCIGTYLAFLDDSEFWKQQGFEWIVFRSGELKGIGEDKLSTEQADYLQSISDKYGANFRKNVLKYRKEIDPADMRGQWFTGLEAAANGFSAGTPRNLEEAIKRFRKLVP